MLLTERELEKLVIYNMAAVALAAELNIKVRHSCVNSEFQKFEVPHFLKYFDPKTLWIF